MPIFPGPVRHNNDNDAILDLTKKQVVGMGIFSSIEGEEGRDALHANMQTDGYIATILDINETYVFLGGTWTDSANWANMGGSVLPGGGANDDVLTRIDEGTGAWKDTLITKNITVKNHDLVPGASEIIFSRRDTDYATSEGDIMGEVRAEGFALSGTLRTGTPSIKFVAGENDVNHTYQSANIEFFVPNDTGTSKVFAMSHDKKVVFASVEDANIPTVVLGGMYYNSTQDNYFVGGTPPEEDQFG